MKEYKVKEIKITMNLREELEKALNSANSWEYEDMKYMENLDRHFIILSREIINSQHIK